MCWLGESRGDTKDIRIVFVKDKSFFAFQVCFLAHSMDMKTLFFLGVLFIHMAMTMGDFYDITVQGEPSLRTKCESWRVNAEIGNAIGWVVIPSGCEAYVRSYMLGGQYLSDVDLMVQEAMSYASKVQLEGGGRDAWVFDIDDTVLSHILYYSEHHFGAKPFNRTSWVEWENLSAAPAIESIALLYNQLINEHWSVFFLTGRSEKRRNVTEENLQRAGFTKWAGLFLRQEGEDTLPAKVYKSAKRHELEMGGYRIWGNMGDQWSDLTGYSTGERVFKVVNPMYCIP
ncbi:hypothetical protein GOP47_0011688 [Adiantum capillus-veneris]|uniref:Acid phosphatase n=1 Tax=Adiantum capillus-veneris TaxID=13818 RepID=A0A9D4ZHW8_ADICA|nr:hypothetical protein GOP47_0011688 [Adiantum capillus-veneris]